MKDSRFSFQSEHDNGMYDAINKGLRESRGDILAYINSDDLYPPDTLDRVVTYFNRHPDVDVVYGDSLVFDSVTVNQHVNVYMPRPERWLRAGGIICQPTVFMRRYCRDNVGSFKKNVKYLGDCEYWLRLIEQGYRFGKIDEILAIEVNHGDTLRSTMRQEIDEEKRYLRENYWPRAPMGEVVRWGVLFSRKLLTPFWYMRLIVRINRRYGSGAWSNFIRNFEPNASLTHYIINKMFRCKLSVWDASIPLTKKLGGKDES